MWLHEENVKRPLLKSGEMMRSLALLGVVLVLFAVSGCTPEVDQDPTSVKSLKETRDFGIYWPPQDPADPAGPIGDPFFHGKLRLYGSSVVPSGITMSIELTRPADEQHREIWNSRLAYREYGWMRRLRVWDVDEKGLWPNLPYLLRAHGKARFERYGGIDPGTGEDNDFAALLIRSFDATGTVESADTRDFPLVSAEWYPVDVGDVDRQTIVHTARSDEFTLPTGNGESSQGRFGVWLIYADFMGAPVPSTWPKKLEWGGGVLAYFEIDWSVEAGGECELSVEQKTPLSDTGFDWESWIGPRDGDERERAVAKLSARSIQE